MSSFESSFPVSSKDKEPSLGELQRESVENSDKLRYLVVLGSGWKTRGDLPEEYIGESHPSHLQMESKMRALAAAEMYKQGLVDRIILSGGTKEKIDNQKVALSEAEGMKEYVLTKYPDVSEDVFVLDSDARDTSQSAENISKIFERLNVSQALLLTSDAHLKRAGRLFRNYRVEVSDTIAAELKLGNRSRHYRRFVDRYLSSSRVKGRRRREMLLGMLLSFDRKGKVLRILTASRSPRQNS